MGGAVHPAKHIEIDEGCGDLDYEEHPLGGPAEHKDMDKKRGRRRVDQGDDEPDPDSGNGAKDHSQQQEEPGMSFGEVKDGCRAFPQTLFLRVNQVKSTAHREMGDEYMQNRN